jgi:glutamine amidotransferase
VTGVNGSCVAVPPDGSPQRYYFTHSYYFDCEDPADIAASVDYGASVTVAVQRNHLWGTQFHPEKSHQFGMRLFQRFAEQPE